MIEILPNHVLFPFDKQVYLSDIIGEESWNVELSTGLIIFGNKLKWQIQLLGTESDETNTWLWAWANTESNIPDHLLQANLQLKTYGEEHDIPELTEPQIPLSHIDDHTLALICSGLCDANAYYRCPYEGGALFVLIMDENFPKCTEPPLQRIVTVFPQAIASLEIPDHKQALAGYLEHYGLGFLQNVKQIVVLDGYEEVLTATFDEQNRLTKLEAKLKAEKDEKSESNVEEKVPAEKSEKAESWEQGQLRRMLGG